MNKTAVSLALISVFGGITNALAEQPKAPTQDVSGRCMHGAYEIVGVTTGEENKPNFLYSFEQGVDKECQNYSTQHQSNTKAQENMGTSGIVLLMQELT